MRWLERCWGWAGAVVEAERRDLIDVRLFSNDRSQKGIWKSRNFDGSKMRTKRANNALGEKEKKRSIFVCLSVCLSFHFYPFDSFSVFLCLSLFSQPIVPERVEREAFTDLETNKKTKTVVRTHRNERREVNVLRR